MEKGPHNQWLVLLICYILTAIGFAGSNIFYDAFLVDVTSKERMSKISSHGLGLYQQDAYEV